MPANPRHAAPQTPASPNAKATARYTNKDGSKIITVPKGPSSAEPSQPSTPTSTSRAPPPLPNNTMETNGPAPPVNVNRKKQKKRAKAAAKAAAAAAAADTPLSPSSETAPMSGQQGRYEPDEDDEPEPSKYDDDEEDGHHDGTTNGVSSAKSKKPKKKKKKNNAVASAAGGDLDELDYPSHPGASPAPPGAGFSKEKIWNTSSQEERERIKEFWLGLGEEDRKSLVKVEKDAVLKKMKEQQKHTCSCTVCGRKRIAIEEELEGLYDAYYEELESFANQPDGPPLPRDFPGRSARLPASIHRHPPSRGRIVEHVGDEEDEDEFEYSDGDLDEDDVSRAESSLDDEHDHEPPGHRPPQPADFLTFGNSLQVKGMKLLDLLLSRYGNMDLGGILTVADDLLKNDGKRFIEMMEQLAERRMAREEDAREHLAHGYGHPANGGYGGHTHPDDEEYDEEEDEEEEYDDSQEDEYEDEDETAMSEEQRMEEGRRMFQIFAARMFEQRVLTAYRNMVAQQRQNQLLEELDEEQRLDAQRKAKKAKDAQKRKDKAALKKQQQAEERAKKEAEKAAEEAAKLDEQRRRAEEQKLRAEDKRRKKEELKRQEEEDRLKKEAERQRRVQEQQDKRAEQERKIREAREKEKRLKEEARLREKEAREQKEKELRDKKEKQERDKRERDAKARADREAKAKADKEAKDRAREEKAAAQQKMLAVSPAPPAAAVPTPLQTSRRPSQPVSAGQATVLPQHPANPAAFASPKVPVATPALPMAPTPMRTAKNAAPSQDASATGSQPSQSGSVHSQNPSPHSATPAHPGPHPFAQPRKSSGILPNMVPHSASASPPNMQGPPGHGPPFGMPPGMQQPPGFGMPPPGFPQRGMPPHDPLYPPMGLRPPPGMMQMPPGMNGPGPAGRGYPPPPPGFGSSFPGEQLGSAGPSPGTTHVRQSSGGYDTGSSPSAQPIGRPAPIGRPGSMATHGSGHNDDLADQHLGSSALLDDSEEPLHLGGRQMHQAPGPRQHFMGGGPFGGFDGGLPPMQNNPWQQPAAAPTPFGSFGPAPVLGGPTWGAPSLAPLAPLPGMTPFRSTGTISRSVALRLLLCRACKEMQGSGLYGPDSFIELGKVRGEVDLLNLREGLSRDGITDQELLDIADTEGTAQNGGGSFDIRRDARGPQSIRWVADPTDNLPQTLGAVGEIGSPIMGASTAAFPTRGS